LSFKPGLAYRINHILWSSLDLFFPPSCGGCGKLGSRWCQACQQRLTPLPFPLCDVCGKPQPQPGICNECKTTRPAFSALRSCFVYTEPARPALIRLKYHREIGLGEALAWHLAVYLDELRWQADLILPVPLSEQRFVERGYNQVDLIAHSLARLVDWQYAPAGLRRIRHTDSQVGLNVTARKINVKGAFQAESRIVAGKTILLIDDVTTTGSTLESSSWALLQARAASVYALTFARALPKFGYDHNSSIPSHLLS